LDSALLTDVQRERLVGYLSRTFDIAEHDVVRGLAELGCPILAKDLIVTVYNPQRWLDD